ncbi:MAG: hypothetical protein Q8L48_09690 [Archangium sp.]|nr:hypothetical protein [Archangium sp.]
MRTLPLLVVMSLLGCSGITSKLCGAPGQPCCAESACDPGALCGAGELCEACGAEAQRCCAQDSCAETLSCVGGACVMGLSCEVNCTLGSSRCLNNGVETCVAVGVCPAWRSTVALCPTGSVCTVAGSTADCVESCPGACTPDTQLCTTEGLRRCVASGTCPSLAAAPDDSDVPQCITGAVINAELAWESPTPVGSDLVDIAGELTASYWVLDELGNIVRYALGPWEYEVRPTPGKRMRRLASCGLGSYLFAAGEGGTVLRRSGGAWTEENVGTSAALADIACDSTRAYAAGEDGKLYVRDGSTWTGYATGATVAFTGITTLFSQQQVFLSGPGGTIVKCDVAVLPATCAAESSGTTAKLNALWGDTFTNQVFAVGEGGTLVRRDAVSWQVVPLTGVTDGLVGVTGWYDASIDSAVVVAISRGGTAVIRRNAMVEEIVQLPDTGLTNAWAPNENTLVFTGQRGALWFRNGLFSQAPFVARGGRKPVTADLNAVTSVGGGRLFAVGDNGARVRRQNGAWNVDALGAQTTAALRGVAARSAGEVYAVGTGGTVLVRRWGTWVAEAQGLTTQALSAVVLDTQHVWALGETQLLEKDLASGTWRVVALPAGTSYVTSLALRKDAAGKALELVIAGHQCTTLSFALDGTDAFSPGPSCGVRFDFNAAAFMSSGDLVLASETGTIHRRTGATLTLENVPGLSLDAFYGLVVDGSTMWAVGAGGRLLRRVATSWSEAAPEVGSSAFFAGVKDEEGLFIVGSGGTVLRRL